MHIWFIENVKVFSESSLVVILILFMVCKIPVNLLTVCDHLAAVTQLSFSISAERRFGFLKVIAIHIKFQITHGEYQENLPVIAQEHSCFYVYGLSVPTAVAASFRSV